ncbi:ABC transporter permease [Sodalis sp. RH21]|uniref:ABC transporter permease n=1 Tax=unclassified Sodalis (in: enterobacteria) TaxID=2636512 RepID=UPI0039B6DFFD
MPKVALLAPARRAFSYAVLGRRLNIEGLATMVIALIAWQIASAYFPPFLFPPLQDIIATFTKLLLNGTLLGTAGLTYLRVIAALSFSFIIATALGFCGGLHRTVDRIVLPFIQFKQGVPSVCWIIFSVLCFKNTEVRIAFIIIVSTVPSLYYLTRDGVKAIPTDLWDMVRAWRPTRIQIARKIIIPAVLPAMVTGLRINIGTAARVGIFAEVFGGISGVGYHLRVAEEQFRMDAVMAWTIILVVLILASDKLMSVIENRLLKSRGLLEQQS